MSRPRNARREIWFFDDRANTYGDEFWHLVNINKDIRSAYALHVGVVGFGGPVEVGLFGWGRQDQTQWKADGGMFWPGSHEDKVVTVLSDGDGNHRAVVADRGAPNQQWRFEEVEVPGESVPTRRNDT
ncbi:hypothetical protein WBG99_17970 [Streptomyces sp. TG1A-60]|uniref:hypothetical protein n=1 Tax=Streptomyces sp. TG1A-60 TaxID=3129111 RepID=UPI0030D23348